eukprot:TRINITY_DN12930_c0_g1_i2.p1 TRINITY_DN12930_c0_g1~~TRINITY_DN12930_c0_g1_i2.p1  ORF type:complete len:995 (-),score=164.81 TRINITY_DN12930_c0_g1_i2:123-3107(-)
MPRSPQTTVSASSGTPAVRQKRFGTRYGISVNTFDYNFYRDEIETAVGVPFFPKPGAKAAARTTAIATTFKPKVAVGVGQGVAAVPSDGRSAKAASFIDDMSFSPTEGGERTSRSIARKSVTISNTASQTAETDVLETVKETISVDPSPPRRQIMPSKAWLLPADAPVMAEPLHGSLSFATTRHSLKKVLFATLPQCEDRWEQSGKLIETAAVSTAATVELTDVANSAAAAACPTKPTSPTELALTVNSVPVSEDGLGHLTDQEPTPADDELVIEMSAQDEIGLIWAPDCLVLLLVFASTPAAKAGATRFIGRRCTHISGVRVLGAQDLVATCQPCSCLRLRFGATEDWPATIPVVQRELLKFSADLHGISLMMWEDVCDSANVNMAKPQSQNLCNFIANKLESGDMDDELCTIIANFRTQCAVVATEDSGKQTQEEETRRRSRLARAPQPTDSCCWCGKQLGYLFGLLGFGLRKSRPKERCVRRRCCSPSTSGEATISFGLSQEEERQARQVFELCDVDDSQKLSRIEFAALCVKHPHVWAFFGFSADDRRDDAQDGGTFADFLSGEIGSSDGEVSWEEFKSFVARRRAEATNLSDGTEGSITKPPLLGVDEQTNLIFDMCDADDSGQITMIELEESNQAEEVVSITDPQSGVQARDWSILPSVGTWLTCRLMECETELTVFDSELAVFEKDHGFVDQEAAPGSTSDQPGKQTQEREARRRSRLAEALRPADRCRWCGKRAGYLFGLRGFGLRQSRHEERCDRRRCCSPSASGEAAISLGLSEEEERQARLLFELCDVDDSQKLSRIEFAALCVKHPHVWAFFGFSADDRRDDTQDGATFADYMFGEIDSSDGEVSWEEFKSFVAKRRAAATKFSDGTEGSIATPPLLGVDEQTNLIFDMCDADDSGQITMIELVAFCVKHPQVAEMVCIRQVVDRKRKASVFARRRRSQFEDIFCEMDVDGSQKVTLEEFHNFVAARRRADALTLLRREATF